MSLEPTSLGPHWWTSLAHGGLLMAPQMVEDHYGADLEPLPAYRIEALRRALTRRAETGVRQLIDTVFVQILGYDAAVWNRNPPPDKWSHRLLTGEQERPDRIYLQPMGDAFPVFTEKPNIRLGYHRGRQSVARVVEWLRRAELKMALLATEQQWRLIYAGSDFEAWCEWDLDLWFEAGAPSPQLEALRRLLAPDSVPAHLLDAIQASRRGQAELTSVLGERVRQAVERLIQSSGANLEKLDVLPSDIYIAATRMMMRCVVALFAEGKGMLGRDQPAYHDSYGVQGLREQLERVSRGRPETLTDTQFGWPRLLGLFRLIHDGSTHPLFLTARYGGTLFQPGKADSEDPVLRAVAAFETAYPCPRDWDVYEILSLLTRTYLKVRQGRGARAVPTPVDFSSLDTEYIGILYEGLLDYDLKRADEPVVFLNMGDEPALRLSDLETITPGKLKDVLGKMEKRSQLAVATDGDDQETDDEESESGDGPDGDAATESEEESDLDTIDEDRGAEGATLRAHEWARNAVRSAGLVRTPRRQTGDANRRYEQDIEEKAKQLFKRVVRPGDWYLVRFGNTRKGSGTFYTRKELASPTVRRTLAPLVQDSSGTIRKPEEILALRVCDPAVGSGSFLISALRYLTTALSDSLHVHDRLHVSGGNRYFDLGIGDTDHLPDTDEFDDQLRARLRRYVVERCLYGVDLNPLAIELARMSLWIETLDPRLPFGFLDHKLRPGNSLVGCWFDHFEDYPIQAWSREGGDKGYNPVHPRANWTQSIAAELRDRVKPSLIRIIGSGAQQRLPLTAGRSAADICDDARAGLNQIHHISGEPDRQREEYLALRGDAGFERLCGAFNMWCALWFWPGDQLRKAPIAADFLEPSEDAERIAQQVCKQYHFFHWELEFPDVFSSPGAGFDAVVGNPPWEIQKPNSKEFFSNIDPLYRAYGKQEAIRRQKEIFSADARHEQSWMAERARLKALSGWVKWAHAPFEYSFGRGSDDLHTRWRTLRHGRTGYADVAHPFGEQGSADLNTYKMFLEAGYRLLNRSGRLGMIVPSGIYSDQGSTALRTLFLEQSEWEWLFSFENREKIFDIHRSFKFNPLIVRKGGRTRAIRTAFMHHDLKDWDEAERHALAYPAERVTQFSPNSKALLEIRSEMDLRTLEKMYSKGVLLGDQSDKGWAIRYATEFHMTNDSHLFRPRPDWEAEGYRSDEYGHWLLGNWTPHEGPREIVRRQRNLVLSADGLSALRVTDIEALALPLYQGVMIQQFDFSAKGWVSGTGLRAKWEEIPWEAKLTRPQYLVSKRDYENAQCPSRIGYRTIARTTDARTIIASVLPPFPAGHSMFVLSPHRPHCWMICAVLDSLAFDYLTRIKIGGVNLSLFFMNELASPLPNWLTRHGQVLQFVRSLSFPNPRFAAEWKSSPRDRAWRTNWAVSTHERLRIRCIVDALIAFGYGLDLTMFRYILDECDLPETSAGNNPKGFWRVDREKAPHLRQTTLSLIAFHELERIGLNAFLSLNDGEGWMLPEKVRLADYDLGRDERAKEHQPVASILGPRFYDWQLAQSVEESWEECERHAELIAKIVGPAEPPEASAQEAAREDLPLDLFGESVPTDLFGTPGYPRTKGKGKRR